MEANQAWTQVVHRECGKSLMKGSLTEGLRLIVEMRWSEFIAMAKSIDATNFDAILTAIVLACRKGDIRAVQTALDRLDGKIATEIDVEFPQFYTLYPLAEKTADDPSIISIPSGPMNDVAVKVHEDTVELPVGSPVDMEELGTTEEDIAEGSLQAMLEALLNSPKDTVTEILAVSELVDNGDTRRGDPRVKSVIVAGLMRLVHEGKMSAVFEVLERIDGKVAEKIKILGGDVFLKNYSLIAPAGAVKNEDGIYQISADNTTSSWALKLEQDNENRRR